MQDAFPFNLPLLMGLSASVVHVLTGPDHLAAVTPLVFNTSRKQWVVGLFWGIGHIVGMLLIGGLYYYFRNYIPIEAISAYSEQFVGILLIGIGIWSFYRIKYKKQYHKHPHIHTSKDRTFVHVHKHKHSHTSHEHGHQKKIRQNFLITGLIGVIHGFAGIAHLVLLLPVLGFTSKTDAYQYLSGFAFGILVAMIAYSVLIGKLRKKTTHPPTNLLRNLQFWSGAAAIVIGCYWLIIN